MNPDGTGQRAIYGSNSWYPQRASTFPRPLPGEPGRLVCILSGYHGPHRMGQLVMVDTAQRLARGRRARAAHLRPRRSRSGRMVRDNLVGRRLAEVPPPFSAQRQVLPRRRLAGPPRRNWGIYLADVFDNLVLVREEPGCALLEPVLLEAPAQAARRFPTEWT